MSFGNKLQFGLSYFSSGGSGGSSIDPIDLSDWENRPTDVGEGTWGEAITGALYRFNAESSVWMRAEAYNDAVVDKELSLEYQEGLTGSESSVPSPWTEQGTVTYQTGSNPPHILFTDTSGGNNARLYLQGQIPNSEEGSIYWSGYAYWESQDLSSPSRLTFYSPNGALDGRYTDYFDPNDGNFKMSIELTDSGESYVGSNITTGSWVWFETYMPDVSDTGEFVRYAWINWGNSLACADDSNDNTNSPNFFAVGSAQFSAGIGTIRLRDFNFIKFNT